MISAVKLSILLSAMAMVESGGNPNAFNYEEQAVGLYQIRPPVVLDVNRVYKTEYQLEDAFDPVKADRIARLYLTYWTAMHRQDSIESAARIWVAGPDGWWQLSSLPYWEKIKRELRRNKYSIAPPLSDTSDRSVQRFHICIQCYHTTLKEDL